MKLHSLFSDGAVLQRRKLIPVFGWTDPDSKVMVSFRGKQFFGMAGANGYFLIRMSPFEAGGPFELEVTNITTGDHALVQDVYVGEVWLASGQSNMAFNQTWLNKERRQTFTLPAPGRVRMFTVPAKASGTRESQIARSVNKFAQEDTSKYWARWSDASEQAAYEFMSSVGVFFADALNKSLEVPVGIVLSAWGGTIVEAWISHEALLNDPEFREKVLIYQEAVAAPERWTMIDDASPMSNAATLSTEYMLEHHCTLNPPDAGSPQGWADIDFDDSKWYPFTMPGDWVQRNLGGSGVFWTRRAVELPESWAGKDLELHLGGVDKQDTTFFNGTEVGHTGSGFDLSCWATPRCYDVRGDLVKAGRNMVAVRAYSFLYGGGCNGDGSQYYLLCKETGEKIFFNGACRGQMEVEFHYDLPGCGVSPEMGPHFANSYGILFESMILPLIPFSFKGIIWYQGESNADSMESAQRYSRLLSTMIRDWRYRFGQGELPFIQTCLAGYTEACDHTPDSPWAELREQQRKTAANVPGCGLISAVDVGDAKDIHPADKLTVGTRMAKWALEHVYNVPGVQGSSPDIRKVTREGQGVLRLTFDHCAGGLTAKNGELTGFYLVDRKGKAVPAQGRIEGKSVILTAEDCPEACRVRYAWSANPMEVMSLYNSEGLPAHPFEMEVTP